MASATIVFNSACPGGAHISLDVTINAGQTRTFSYTADEVRSAISVAEIREVALTMAKFHCGGMTRAQAKAELDPPGISVSTSS